MFERSLAFDDHGITGLKTRKNLNMVIVGESHFDDAAFGAQFVILFNGHINHRLTLVCQNRATGNQGGTIEPSTDSRTPPCGHEKPWKTNSLALS